MTDEVFVPCVSIRDVLRSRDADEVVRLHVAADERWVLEEERPTR